MLYRSPSCTQHFEFHAILKFVGTNPSEQVSDPISSGGIHISNKLAEPLEIQRGDHGIRGLSQSTRKLTESAMLGALSAKRPGNRKTARVELPGPSLLLVVPAGITKT
eukprot:756782-Hanusia_phi.AAC.2